MRHRVRLHFSKHMTFNGISTPNDERLESLFEVWEADAFMNRAALCQVFDSIYRELDHFLIRGIS